MTKPPTVTLNAFELGQIIGALHVLEDGDGEPIFEHLTDELQQKLKMVSQKCMNGKPKQMQRKKMTKTEALEKYPQLKDVGIFDLIKLRHEAIKFDDTEFREAIDVLVKPETDL